MGYLQSGLGPINNKINQKTKKPAAMWVFFYF